MTGRRGVWARERLSRYGLHDLIDCHHASQPHHYHDTSGRKAAAAAGSREQGEGKGEATAAKGDLSQAWIATRGLILVLLLDTYKP